MKNISVEPALQHITITAQRQEQHMRLDQFLSSRLPDFSRSRLQQLIENGSVMRGEIPATNRSYHIKDGDSFTISIPMPKETQLTAKAIPLDIIYEDEDLLVINKPAGLTVHPGAGNHDDTLANALLAHCGHNLSGIGGELRPGIVHRLDKDTTGLLVAAKNDKAHVHLSRQLEERLLKRTYTALIWGMPHSTEGTIEGNIGRSPKNRKKMAVLPHAGKRAVTHYSVLDIFLNGLVSLIECRLETGRTHQIRVHFSHIGHSLIGDPQYGTARKKALGMLPVEMQEYIRNFPRQALHSTHISFVHPTSGETLSFSANLPEDMQQLLDFLAE